MEEFFQDEINGGRPHIAQTGKVGEPFFLRDVNPLFTAVGIDAGTEIFGGYVRQEERDPVEVQFTPSNNIPQELVALLDDVFVQQPDILPDRE